MKKKKVLSFALAFLMLASSLSLVIPAVAATNAFSVENKSGEAVGSYATYSEALEAVYSAGGGTINMLADYTVTESYYTDTDTETRTDIVINGNNKTLKGGHQPFTFNGGDNITVNDLKVEMSGSKRIAEFYGGTTLTFNNVNFTSSVAADDNIGHFRTPTVGSNTNSAVNTLNFNDCSITLTGKGTVIGIKQGGDVVDVNMDGCTVTGNTPSDAQHGGFIYGARNITLNDTNVNVEDRAFWDLRGGNTVRITGDSTVRVRKWAKFIISVMNDYDFILGDNVKLIGHSLAEAKQGVNFLNIYAYNPNFYYTDPDKIAPYFPAPVMNEGATLRVSAEQPNYGLRFTSTCAPASAKGEGARGTLVDHVKYGTVITKDTYLEKGLWAEGVQGKANSSDTGIFLSAEAKNGMYTDENGMVTINAALANIKDENLKSTFYARSYAEYSLDKYEMINVYVFSRFYTAKHGASYTDTINKTLANSVKDTAEQGYTTEVDSYVATVGSGYAWTEGKKYTCYSKEQYDVLKAIATK